MEKYIVVWPAQAGVETDVYAESVEDAIEKARAKVGESWDELDMPAFTEPDSTYDYVKDALARVPAVCPADGPFAPVIKVDNDYWYGEHYVSDGGAHQFPDVLFARRDRHGDDDWPEAYLTYVRGLRVHTPVVVWTGREKWLVEGRDEAVHAVFDTREEAMRHVYDRLMREDASYAEGN